MRKLFFFFPLVLSVSSFTAQAVTDGTLLESVQIVSGGKTYSIQAFGIKSDNNALFATNVIIKVCTDPQMRELTSFVIDNTDTPWGITLEKAHILPGEDEQFVICLYSGGNDIVASCGARYYSIEADKTRQLIYIEWGDPQVSDVDGDGISEIVTEAEYWGQFLCHADCIAYLDAIYGFDGKNLNKQTEKYRKLIPLDKSALDQYEQVRAQIMVQGKSYEGLNDEDRLDIFRAAVAALLAYRNSWLRDNAKQWWQSNANFLSQAMDADHYGEVLLELEPTNGRMWNGADYTSIR